MRGLSYPGNIHFLHRVDNHRIFDHRTRYLDTHSPVLSVVELFAIVIPPDHDGTGRLPFAIVSPLVRGDEVASHWFVVLVLVLW